MSGKAQSFEHHAKMVPAYHYWMSLFLLVPTVYFGYLTVTAYSVGALMTFSFAIGVVMAALFARVFPLGVQDRVIRLEERLRMERVLPDDMKGQIESISTDSLIGLRFASDEELVALVRRVIDGELTDRKSIKQAVRTWRPDSQRI